MIRSMTGFGRCRATVNGREITVEIKSVNSRFFDCSVKISRVIGYLEERIKPYLQSRGIARGKVDVWIGVENVESEGVRVELDEAYLEGYLAALKRLKEDYGLRDDVSVMTVAKNQQIFTVRKPDEDVEKDWQDLLEVLASATDAFLAVREREGETLAADIREKAQHIRQAADEVERLSQDSIVHYRERLAEKIRDALADNRIQPDESRILTECAIFADKVAVDEELVRLRTHFGALEQILDSGEPVGRKLDFLLQEMNREVNTTGSKCNNAEIACLVVDMKCELEKIREQIQNLE